MYTTAKMNCAEWSLGWMSFETNSATCECPMIVQQYRHRHHQHRRTLLRRCPPRRCQCLSITESLLNPFLVKCLMASTRKVPSSLLLSPPASMTTSHPRPNFLPLFQDRCLLNKRLPLSYINHLCRCLRHL